MQQKLKVLYKEVKRKPETTKSVCSTERLRRSEEGAALYVAWNYIHALFSNVTPAKWWIMIYSENRTDEQLYSKLAKRAKYFHPYVWTAKTCQTMAEGFLHSTAHQMSEEGVQDMCEQLAAFRTFSYGAGPIDG